MADGRVTLTTEITMSWFKDMQSHDGSTWVEKCQYAPFSTHLNPPTPSNDRSSGVMVMILLLLFVG